MPTANANYTKEAAIKTLQAFMASGDTKEIAKETKLDRSTVYYVLKNELQGYRTKHQRYKNMTDVERIGAARGALSRLTKSDGPGLFSRVDMGRKSPKRKEVTQELDTSPATYADVADAIQQAMPEIRSVIQCEIYKAINSKVFASAVTKAIQEQSEVMRENRTHNMEKITKGLTEVINAVDRSERRIADRIRNVVGEFYGMPYDTSGEEPSKPWWRRLAS